MEVPQPEAQATPEQLAAEHYNAGLAYRDQAWKLHQKLATGEIPEGKRQKTEEKITKAFEHAIDEYSKAIASNEGFHQAYGDLGYAFRMVGDYNSALQAYDKALDLEPGYVEAIEYRGEAYLGLNRINDAQNAYRVLLEKDPALAADLLGAMRAWIRQRRAEPAGVEVASLDGLERWVDDREQAGAAASSREKIWRW
jgi:tetratricopeptide (TPR) repeat protein